MENHIAIIRNAKCWGIYFTEEFLDDYKRTISINNKVTSRLRRGLTSGEIEEIVAWDIISPNGNKKNVKKKDGTYNHGGRSYYTAADYVKLLDTEGIFEGALKGRQSFKRMILYYCMERFRGYKTRNNGKKMPNIGIKENKSLYYKESNLITVDTENNKLTVKTLFDEHDLTYKYNLKMEHIKPKGKAVKITTGGNFCMKQRAFVGQVKFNKPTIYEPTSVLSFDLNKKASDWIVFNDGEKIVRQGIIEELCKEIKQLNTLLDPDKKKPVAERKIRTRKRSKVRRQVQEKHKKQSSLINPIADYICQKAVAKNGLLCIDSVKTGQSNGTFGQDKLIPALVTKCENMGIPFYEVPCAYTSRRCMNCGSIEKKNRKSTSEFECIDCGHKCDAQKNGADNIAYHGDRMYNAGVPYGNWAGKKKATGDKRPRKHSVDDLVKIYSQQ